MHGIDLKRPHPGSSPAIGGNMPLPPDNVETEVHQSDRTKKRSALHEHEPQIAEKQTKLRERAELTPDVIASSKGQKESKSQKRNNFNRQHFPVSRPSSTSTTNHLPGGHDESSQCGPAAAFPTFEHVWERLRCGNPNGTAAQSEKSSLPVASLDRSAYLVPSRAEERLDIACYSTVSRWRGSSL
ncbi:hypothetical protein BT69DRAFT_50873 [Atractiella rhizophila]|nr:hypothetical protein BT69DRAFT_50873 [Atractiella rhizophila]